MGILQKLGNDKNINIDIEEHEDEKVAMQIHDDEESENEEVLDLKEYEKYDGEFPVFVRWNGDIQHLLQQLKKYKIIKEDRKKIVTHTNSMIYDYNEWNDISLNYPNFDKHEITKLSVSKSYCLSNNETRDDFNEQKQAFLARNNKDEFQSFNEKIDIRGFKNCLTIKKRDNLNGGVESTPFWYTIKGYWIFSCFLLTLYPRYKCCTMFGRKSWKIIKAISI